MKSAITFFLIINNISSISLAKNYEELVKLIKEENEAQLKSTLINNKEAILAKNKKNENIVHFLAYTNNIKPLKIIINNTKTNLVYQAINTKNNQNKAALHIAVENDARDLAIYLLSKGAWVDLPGPDDMSSYFTALQKKHYTMACILILFSTEMNMPADEKKTDDKIKTFSSECKNFIQKNGHIINEKNLLLLLDLIDDLNLEIKPKKTLKSKSCSTRKLPIKKSSFLEELDKKLNLAPLKYND